MKDIKRRSYCNIDLPDSICPALERILSARGVSSIEDINYSLSSLLSFSSLTGIEESAQLLFDMLIDKKRILIVADYDVDGATSCALAIRGLTMMGFDNVVYIVPDRFKYGYGLSPEIVHDVLDYDPDLLITVDNGISSIEGVRYAKQHELKVLITDHHIPPTELPNADVIVNPQLPGDLFPSKNLAGVGVIFYVLLALRSKLKQELFFDKNNIRYPNLANLLDLVALGTIADVVPLDKNNRILVAHGLKIIRNNKSKAGIKALFKYSGRSLENINSTDLGFFMAPRLNAAGRLTDMSLGIECLLTDNDSSAMDMALELNNLNKERKQIQNEMHAQALFKMEENLDNELVQSKLGICLYDQDWHQGVIGILASKIKEKFNRPVIIFAGENKNILKGSARSIQNLHIRDVIEEIARKNPNLVLTFGGHAMAAGLSIHEKNIKEFTDSFEKTLRDHINIEDIIDDCLTDGELLGSELSLQFAEQVYSISPWGRGFPDPVFDGEFKIVGRYVVGINHLKLILRKNENSKTVEAIFFNIPDKDRYNIGSEIHIVYRLNINEYNHTKKLQLILEHIRLI